MKRSMTLVALMVSVLLVLTAVAGCAQESPEKGAADLPANAQNPADEPSQNIPDLPDSLLSQGWPADEVPPELPEYTGGTVVNSGGDQDTLYIKISDTDQEKLEDYLEQLRENGWIVTGDSSEAQAVLGLHTVDFDWQGGETMLQISLYTQTAGAWPKDQIPPDILEPQTGELVGEIEVLETSENAWYFNYTYDGIDEAAAQEYMELLIENGWSGDVSQIYKTFEWNGKRCEASIEIYEIIETRTTFICNFCLSE